MIDKMVSVIIVSFNVKGLLNQCLHSLLHHDQEISLEIIIIDNNSTDGTSQMISEEFIEVRNISYIRNHKNLGFAKANNQAIKYCKGDYILFLNPDTIVKERTIRSLVEYLESHPDVGIVSPKIFSPQGKLCLSCGKKLNIYSTLIELSGLYKFLPSLGKHRFANWDYDQTKDVDWVSGVCFLTRKSVLEKVRGFDEVFFMYAEDVDLCLRVKDVGYRVVFNPNAEIIHYGGQSRQRLIVKSLEANYKARIYYIHKYYGSLQAKILKLFLIILSVIKIMVAIILLLLNKKYAEIIKAYYNILQKIVSW